MGHTLAALSAYELTAIASACAAVGGSLVGLLFRGAASAWREERDAAVDKAERLEEKVDEQASQIETLKQKVDELERRTNFEPYADRMTREHNAILEELRALTKSVNANTVALEFFLKHAFPVELPPAA